MLPPAPELLVGVAVNLIISDQTLLGDDDSPAVVDGYGPVSAAVARSVVSDAVLDEHSKATLRRRYRHPKSAALVATESRSRLFPKGLAEFIGLRPDLPNFVLRCADPAPRPRAGHAGGGPTSALNGLGECQRCNYVKESPGWEVRTEDESGFHTAEFVTPTGAHYRSTAPPPPGPVEV